MWPEAAITRWIADTKQLCSPPPSITSPPSAPATEQNNIRARKRRHGVAMEEEEEEEEELRLPQHNTDANVTHRPQKAPRRGNHYQRPLYDLTLQQQHQQQQQHRPATPNSTVSSSSVSLGSSSVSFKRKRGSRSPTKRLTDREYSNVLPTQRRPIKSLEEIPASLHLMIKTLTGLGKGKGVLHERDAELLPRLSGGLDPEMDAAMLARGEAAAVRDQLGQAVPWETVSHLERKAERNFKDGSPESAWNVEVHGPLLDAALLTSSHRHLLDVRDITTARIHPASLLGDATVTNKAVESKRVDFCVSVQLDLARYKPALHRIASLNHTDYNPLRYQPIAISIETKSYGPNDPQAILQLTTWGCAQLVLLQSFRRVDHSNSVRHPHPPALPLIVVAGHTWTLHLLHVRSWEAGREQESEATLWMGVEIGNTRSAAGIYALVACLQYLFDWTQTVYRRWFEDEILNPLANGSGSWEHLG
jgi:hypothetical protein